MCSEERARATVAVRMKSVTVISVTPRRGPRTGSRAMSVESIFVQLHDPAPPNRRRQSVRCGPHDLWPSPMPVENLRRWTPARTCTAGAEAERPTMWLMTDLEALGALIRTGPECFQIRHEPHGRSLRFAPAVQLRAGVHRRRVSTGMGEGRKSAL